MLIQLRGRVVLWSDLTNHKIISNPPIFLVTNVLASFFASAVTTCIIEELRKLIDANNKVIEAKKERCMEQNNKVIKAKMERCMEQNNKVIEAKMEENTKLLFEKLDTKFAENNAMLLESIVKILKKD